MDRLLQDLRYALRSFAKAPGFTALALLTIGIGIGVNTTVFSFVNALLLRPAPGIPEPGSLVALYTSDYSSGLYGTSSYPDYVSIKTEASAFRGVTAYWADRCRPSAPKAPSNASGRPRSPADFFEAAWPAARGGQDDRAPTPTGARRWRSSATACGNARSAAAPSAIGSGVTVNETAMTIVGVAPERFDGLDLGTLTEVWVPLVATQ